MSGINNQRVHTSLNQSLGPLKRAVAHANGSRHPQAAVSVLAGIGIFYHLLNILNGHQTFKVVILVHNRQLFNPVLLQYITSFINRSARRRRHQVFRGHNLLDRAGEILLKAQIPVGQNAHQPALHRHRHTGNMVTRHQFQRVLNCIFRRKKNRINNNTVLRALNAVNLSRLCLNRHIFVNNANAALPGNRNRHPRFRNSVHTSADNRHIQTNVA